jgi:hypothetical protein
MIPEYCPISPTPKKLKVIYGWYIYTVYALLIFNIYLAVYNVCVRHPFEAPLILRMPQPVYRVHALPSAQKTR